MNWRVIIFQVGIFATQWVLMVLGFGILARIIVPLKLFGPGIPFGTYLEAGTKALIALGLSVFWLLLWDRQVRVYFYRNNK